ncbi:hypothetical protein EN45_024210 [Penicillium chrysogenum]|uniref:Pc18g05930 protein n=2 Tax=Penicillium chrysogenum species complex TaxID=254878 RepID=B6HCD9_PENRW|nr:uncharacterized protein N7525_000419 [Penicillium rubens]KAJ5039839.1 hypothetical protein NUH16_009632 [Penicillium rubens]KAJ5842678.1 hypothetical protein N7525_000419 [Penicillium rubens]KZN92267.1 hypothetical protein EN45_024210 [Penicillium chrysogenum]CAP94817.1 Pc18g05930 [Penicillium rubens Wisconsin 54-1255]
MDITRSGRKRKSSLSSSRSQSPVSSRTRRSLAAVPEDASFNQQQKTVSVTPKKSRKRVRFSDPGPRVLHDEDAGSTGLTPAMRRTSFETGSGDCSPSRKSRRRSAPTPRFQRSYYPEEPLDETCTERRIQFTPLRQILDTRTQRRIRRIGLSDEINQIEREKRETRKMEKTMRALLQERDSLKDELRAMRRGGMGFEDNSLAESYWMTPDTPRSCEELSVVSNHGLDDATPFSNSEGESFMFNDSAVVVSSSPDFRTRSHNPPVTDSLMLADEHQTHKSVDTEESGIHSLALDLEAARQEKKDLFDACRLRISGFNDPTISSLFRQSSPPSDFFENIMKILENALSRAADAAEALEGVTQECSGLGFSGDGVDDVISDMRNHFRSARLELERALPGETANVSLGDGKATLSALVRRVESLAKDLGTERHYHDGSLGREKALRGQFDALLHRYETATRKIDSLEDSIASSASDMLHTRMRMQELEREGQEQAVGIDRLSTALDKYHYEVKGLESLIDNLEKENTATKEDYTRQISKLKKQVAHERSKRLSAEATASESESRIRELEGTVEHNRIRACDLMAQVELLEKEHQRATESLEQNRSELQAHEAETGTLNVRISDLATSLHGAKCEMQRLQNVNTGLEEQLQLEFEARNELLDKWAADQVRSFAHMKETINSERRRAKVRAANWELKSDDLMSDGTTIGGGSEPITPVSARFVDVEVGRGKDRRRMDSVEILGEGLDLPASDLA